MNLEPEQLVKEIRSRFDHATQKKLLREKYHSKMVFGWNGGMFRATPEMISFLSLYDSQQIVLEDLYGTPIEVNAQELRNLMQLRWQEQMNGWAAEHQELSKQR
jgi:hypothetical protein